MDWSWPSVTVMAICAAPHGKLWIIVCGGVIRIVNVTSIDETYKKMLENSFSENYTILPGFLR